MVSDNFYEALQIAREIYAGTGIEVFIFIDAVIEIKNMLDKEAQTNGQQQ